MSDSSMTSASNSGSFANVSVPTISLGDTGAAGKVHKREARIVDRIRMMIGVHPELSDHAEAVRVSVESTVVVLRGTLPTQDLKSKLTSVIRQGGVLLRINNSIDVQSYSKD